MTATAQKPGYFTKDTPAEEIRDFYAENGYLVLVDGFTEAEIRDLNAETVAICRGERGEIGRGWTEKESKAAIYSNDAEKDEAARLSDDEVISKFLCIHFPHKTSKVMYDALSKTSVADVLTTIIGPNVKCMQSMLFIKAAGKPGQAWHQDEDYIPTRDRSLTGAWIAMDDATIDNGCLWVIPGSHKHGILWPQYPHDDKQFDCAEMSFDFPYEDERDSIPVEVPKGAVVFFNGYLLHRSLPNRKSYGFRRSLVNHYMSAESFLPWRVQEGVGTAKMDFRDIVMVAGKDPYAYKGTVDKNRPHVRPAGDGGCGDGRVDLETHKKKLAGTVS